MSVPLAVSEVQPPVSEVQPPVSEVQLAVSEVQRPLSEYRVQRARPWSSSLQVLPLPREQKVASDQERDQQQEDECRLVFRSENESGELFQHA